MLAARNTLFIKLLRNRSVIGTKTIMGLKDLLTPFILLT